jgi:subfamily B ATP-binding cassette protein MsbA
MRSYARFLARILAYFRRDRALIAALVVLIAVSLAADVLSAWPLAIMVDVVFAPMPRSDRLYRAFLALLPAHKLGQVVGLALMWLILKVSLDVMFLCRMMINNRLKYSGTARVRTQLFDHLLRQNLAFHRTRPQGDLIYRVTTDAWGFFGVLDTFVGAAVSAATLVAVGAVMWSRNVPVTVVTLAVAPPALVLVNLYFGRTIRSTALGFKRAESLVMTAAQRAMAAVGLVQLFGRQGHESGRFRGEAGDAVDAGMKMGWQEQLYPLAVQTVFSIGRALVIGVGGYFVYRDFVAGVPNGFTMGAVLAFLIYYERLWDPINRLTGFPAAIAVNAAACDRVFQVLDRDPDVQDAPDAAPLPVRPRTLRLEAVSFAYDSGRPVLSGIDATIRPGEMVAFVGPSGAGKSTLLNLLPRFYDATAGAITLDGHDLRALKVDDVRRHVTLVPQDSALLPTTVSENISYGREAATQAQVREAARLAGAAEFIEQMPEGYETPISESAQNLSGGQRQRLAIARALLSEAPLLVLDEPTSALDPHNEQHVLQTLRSLKGRRTLVLVTHRIESAADCDRIYVLCGGRIVEQGSHASLMAAGGAYARMARGQRPEQDDVVCELDRIATSAAPPTLAR